MYKEEIVEIYGGGKNKIKIGKTCNKSLSNSTISDLCSLKIFLSF